MNLYSKPVPATNELLTSIPAVTGLVNTVDQTIRFKQASFKLGVAALQRLVPVAQGSSNQSSIVALFLLSCHDTFRYSFSLSEFRLLNLKIYQDCMAVLNLNWSPEKPLHGYLKNGDIIFQQLATRFSPKAPVQELNSEN